MSINAPLECIIFLILIQTNSNAFTESSKKAQIHYEAIVYEKYKMRTKFKKVKNKHTSKKI